MYYFSSIWLHILLYIILFTVVVLISSTPEKRQNFNRLIPKSTQRFAMYPSPCKLGIRVLGYLLVYIGLETALSALCRQVLISLASTVSDNLSDKCTLCSFNSSTPEFMLECTSPCKLGSVNLNMNLKLSSLLFRKTSY